MTRNNIFGDVIQSLELLIINMKDCDIPRHTDKELLDQFDNVLNALGSFEQEVEILLEMEEE
jgi:hypothetical protein